MRSSGATPSIAPASKRCSATLCTLSAFDPAGAEIFIDDGDHFVASYRSVLLQIRRGAMTLPVLEQMESLLRILRARQRGKEGALLAVLEESAELSSGPVRARQTALIRELLGHERSWAATIVAGGTAKSALLRTFMRLLALGHPRAGVFGNPREAGAWLEARVNVPGAELADFVAWGLRVGRPAPERDVTQRS